MKAIMLVAGLALAAGNAGASEVDDSYRAAMREPMIRDRIPHLLRGVRAWTPDDGKDKLRELYKLLSAYYANEGQGEPAVAFADKIIEMAPRYAMGYKLRSTGRMIDYRFREAEADLMKATTLVTPDQIRAGVLGDYLLAVCEIRRAQGRQRHALEACDRAVQAGCVTYPCFLTRAYVLADLGQFDRAEADVKRSAEHVERGGSRVYTKESLRPRVQVASGYVHFLRRDDSKALRDYERALEFIDPNGKRSADAYFRRGQLYARQGKLDLAVKDLDASLQVSPEDSEVLHERGNALKKLGRSKESADDLAKACRKGRSAACR